MGCLEFCIAICFLASAAFFILFLVVDDQTPFYPYAFPTNSSIGEIDKKPSATACIVTSSLYLLIAISLLFWKKSRDKRIQEIQKYSRLASEQEFEQQKYSQKGRSIEL